MSTRPIRIKALDHVVLRVRDLSRSIEFYESVLGCVVERQIEQLGLHQLRAGRSLIDLVAVDSPLGRAGGEAPATQAPNVDHFALSLEAFDVDAIQAHLRSLGIESGEPSERYGAEGFGPSIYLKDPDGNTVELKGPATSGASPGRRPDR